MTDLTMATQLLARADDDRPGLFFEDDRWTWREVIDESLARAAALAELLDDGRPPHIGVLLENVPDYLFWLGGAAIAGATVVGINPTRRGDDLIRDITHTDCQLLITEPAHAELVPDDLPIPALDIESEAHAALVARHRGAPAPNELPEGDTRFVLLFTSGSTSAPKAVPNSNGRVGGAGARASKGYGVTDADIVYCPMPLFHGNALIASWSIAVAAAAPVVLRRRFSASSFIDDARRYGCTYFSYVGRTISYVLAQPARDDDADNPLRLGFGTEAPATDRTAFAERFGATLVEGYGSSESAIVITRTPDTPAGALGKPRPDMEDAVAVVDSSTGDECPRGIVDANGRLTNPEEAIGELVNRSGGAGFTGYYNNPEATDQRLRNGWFWSGDLAWRDAEGFYWFAGRTVDWMRVDSENISAAPIASLLLRFPGVTGAVVHAVPDERTGDQVMAMLELEPGEGFDAAAFGAFLDAQPDLGTKWAPRYVRIVDALPVTANNKTNFGAARRAGVAALAAEAGSAGDELWWRADRELSYQPFGQAERAALHERFAEHGRLDLLDR